MSEGSNVADNVSDVPEDQRQAQQTSERIAALESENQELQERLAMVLRSTSWRMTRPIRIVSNGLRRMRSTGRRRELVPSQAVRNDAVAIPAAEVHIYNGEVVKDPRSIWVLQTGLFDASHYREAASLGPVSDLAAAEHYVTVGESQGLPPNMHFDPLVYVDLYREVPDSGMGVLLHFAHYGRPEGRITRFDPEADLKPGRRAPVPGRSTVLLVCHEASRTGAPILGWNIARLLNREHDVVVALVNPEEELRERFVEEAVAVAGPFEAGQLTWFYMARLGRYLSERFAFDFAIANSIECFPMLVGLADAGVPTVTLVHEYPATKAAAGRMQGGMMLSQQVVFDSTSQHRDALACWPGITPRNQHVFHQGASEVPTDPKAPVHSADERAAKRARIYKAVRGDGSKPVVLGLGTLSMRKGPDLFVSCARAAARRIAPAKARFVWIGNVPSPHPEGFYMDWVTDQVKRSGLGSEIVFLDPVDDLEGAYVAADAVMISSRLDPFPNVAMDAALAGVPVVCFGEANGFADWLAEDPRTAELAVGYLDTDAAGAALARFLSDPKARHAAGEAVRERGHADFSMKRYMERLAPVIADAKAIAAQEKDDIAVLLADDTFSAELWQNPDEPYTREEAIRMHVRKAASGQEAQQYCRRPALGFVPQTYADHHPELERLPYPNPLAHWIRAGKPTGSWTHPVLIAPQTKPTGQGATLRAALHIHLHYPELAEDMLAALAGNAARLDLFVSTTSPEKAEDLRGRFAGYAGGTVVIEACPNRGRDVGPMLTHFAPALQGYDVFGHMHGKRSLALTTVGLDVELGVRWHGFLLQHLLGDRNPMVDLVLDRFASEPALGLVFPEDPNLTGWCLDREIARDLARRMDPAMQIPQSIDFPIGTMFWARPAALKPLFDLRLGWDDYPEEPVPIDGTMLHALERLLPVIATHSGFGWATTHVPGVTR
jgi:glycosyltransferase involved in cell wall biosynthesis